MGAHQSKIVKISEILEHWEQREKLQKSTDKLYKEFIEHAKNLLSNACTQIWKKDIFPCNDCIADLSAKCQNVEAILHQMKNNLSSITKLDRHLITIYTKVNIHLGDIQAQMIKIHNLNIKQGSDGTKFLQKLKDCHINFRRSMSETQEILSQEMHFMETCNKTLKLYRGS